MIRSDCKFCGENIFDVVDIEHLGTLPHTWVCSGCGREYKAELNHSGKLVVYRKGRRPKSLKRKPKKIEPAPGPEEPAPEPEDLPGPVSEESAEEVE